MHLTGLFLLSQHLTGDNAAALLGEARGKSRRQIEQLIARWFPRPDVPPSLTPVNADPLACSRAGEPIHGRLEPLSPTRLRVEFTAPAELYKKVERARELLSHAVPSGDLGELFERALDALIEQETRKRFGTGKARKVRKLKPGSRHVPVEIERAVWERDKAPCTFVDGEGRRCAERRFLTIEHRTPHARKGPPTLENLCLLCSAHNLENARQVFGESHIEAKLRERTPAACAGKPKLERGGTAPLEIPSKVLSSLCSLGFGRSEASGIIGQALGREPGLDVEQLLRQCLLLLVPKAS
jgi:5-methylcytosine-specific restriction endonuclease McrA